MSFVIIITEVMIISYLYLNNPRRACQGGGAIFFIYFFGGVRWRKTTEKAARNLEGGKGGVELRLARSRYLNI
jgi:hypothetical protein